MHSDIVIFPHLGIANTLEIKYKLKLSRISFWFGYDLNIISTQSCVIQILSIYDHIYYTVD